MILVNGLKNTHLGRGVIVPHYLPKVIPIFSCSCKPLKNRADVAKLADAHDLGLFLFMAFFK
jgi:hypothetical protein